MKQYDILVSRGDTQPIVFTLKNNGVALDLTGATVTISTALVGVWRGVDFDAPYSDDNLTNSAATTGSGLLTVSGASVTLTTPASGIVTWTPSSTAFSVGGDYVYQFKIVYADGTVENAPILAPRARLPLIRVGAALASMA